MDRYDGDARSHQIVSASNSIPEMEHSYHQEYMRQIRILSTEFGGSNLLFRDNTGCFFIFLLFEEPYLPLKFSDSIKLGGF